MKKRIAFYVFTAVICTHSVLLAQEITKTSASPVAGTVCPGVSTFYEVSVPSGFGGCTITWSATNGQATKDQSDQRKVKVVWTDTPGATGMVTATFSACGSANEGNNGASASKSELILSVKGQSFGSYDNSIDISYCFKSQVYITVPPMVVQGTGGIAQPPRTEVAYAWTLPPGWREVGTNRTGEFGTSTHDILIEPIDCAKKGIVKVEGALIGVGLCDAAGLSAPATISLNGTDPVVTVAPQPGYTGASACNKEPVTFYAISNVGCVNSYNWVLPSSWTEESRSGNSITARPTGTTADAANIIAKINYNCGNEVTGIFKPSFKEPLISSPPAICNGGSVVTLHNAPTNGVTWLTSSNMSVVSGQGTPTPVIAPASPSTRGAGFINATISCLTGTAPQVPTKSVWVGKPNMVAALNNGQLITYSSSVNNVCNYIEYNTVMNVSGSTSNVWSRIAASPSNTSWVQQGNNITFYFWAVGQTATYRLVSGNSCGSGQYDFKFKSVSCSSNPCSQYLISPNPSDREIGIVVPNIPAPCDDLRMVANPDMVLQPRPEGEQENHLSIRALELYNSDGQVVKSARFETTTKNTTLNISDLDKGIYYLKVSDGTYIETHRVQIR